MALSVPANLESGATKRQSKNKKMTFENLQSPDFFGWMGRPGMRSFDHEIIRSRLSELKSIRQKGDVHELLYYFSEGIHGNMAGMGTPEIYESNDNHEAYDLIKSYVDEISLGLSQIADLPPDVLSDSAKLAFLQRSSQAYGRCALMLSGAGSMAPFHLGVCKALVLQGLLPTIISGSSGGAIIAAIVCTRDDEELETLLQSEMLAEMFNLVHAAYEADTKLLSGDDVAKIICAWIPDVTFAEAYKKTGRHLCISVAPAELHQQSRTLNSITTPNVLLRESIQASCAVPGFMEPVKLMARGIGGERVPYVSSRSWIDGSVTDDLPASRLRRIFGCNFFIASQTNPMILWSVQDPNSRGPMSDWLDFWQSASKEWVKAFYPAAQKMVQNVYPMNLVMRMYSTILTQDYTADVNILPTQKFVNPNAMLEVIEPKAALDLVNDGEANGWRQIRRIRNCIQIGLKIDSLITDLSDDDNIHERDHIREGGL